MNLAFSLNGEDVEVDAPANAVLLDVLRDGLGRTGTKGSCGVQVCGACSVLLDGELVSSCCLLAHDAAGREVMTIEGLVDEPLMTEIADSFLRHAASQCGFCTPGMALTIWASCRDGLLGDEHAAREALAGNLCRCTGYKAIIDVAVEIGASHR